MRDYHGRRRKYVLNISWFFSQFSEEGVPLIPRKMVVASNPVVEVRRDGDTWTIRMNTLVRTVEYVFEPGQTVETETMGGMAQNVFTIEDDKIMQTQKSDTYTTEVIRQFTEDSLIMTITHVESGIICHRYFRRL
ncbi:sodium/calcium exchanger regulatory protein 1-like isoform X1 [Penaeus monodon]|uniref:sodium/calcium exchanger regulatory protein 1-like isoform X1 n=1 Tax=Penaeus monodon TaxID=6687 RepID=UPI0018A6E9F1|nr:sodium/calcium exchanger regulatory protein 1-like isoform X1 [Penaeus monodon]